MRLQDCWEVAETDKSVWVAHQAEPNIWFALVSLALNFCKQHAPESLLTMFAAGSAAQMPAHFFRHWPGIQRCCIR